MKIIALVKENYSSNEWLIQATGDEIAKIAGFPYASSMNKDERPAIGVEVKVDEAWNDLRKFRAAKDHLKSASETLRGVAAIADAAGAVYTLPAPKEEEPAP